MKFYFILDYYVWYCLEYVGVFSKESWICKWPFVYSFRSFCGFEYVTLNFVLTLLLMLGHSINILQQPKLRLDSIIQNSSHV